MRPAFDANRFARAKLYALPAQFFVGFLCIFRMETKMGRSTYIWFRIDHDLFRINIFQKFQGNSIALHEHNLKFNARNSRQVFIGGIR